MSDKVKSPEDLKEIFMKSIIDFDELNKLGFDSISLSVSGGRELKYIREAIEEWLEAEDIANKYLINIVVEILGTNLDTEKSTTIGELTGTFFESELLIDDMDFYYLCDSIETDLEHMASAIVDNSGNIKEEICNFDENLMYIDRIFIEEKYRGLGIASYVLNNINEILEYSVNLSPHVLILLPVPQEKDENGLLREIKNKNERDAYKQKLIGLYKTLGFKKLKKSNYMVKRTKNLGLKS